MAKEPSSEQREPVYYKGRRKTLKVDGALLIDIFKMCSKLGQLDALQELLVKRGSVVTVETELANDVKALFFENNLHTQSRLALSITGFRDPRCPNPYHCPHARD